MRNLKSMEEQTQDIIDTAWFMLAFQMLNNSIFILEPNYNFYIADSESK